MEPLSILLICVFLQVGLTFWAIASMGLVRISSLKAREVSLSEIALGNDAYPLRVKPYQNNAQNQLESPVLLYAVVAIAAATGAVNYGVAIGAVIFIITRFVHRAIHVGGNNLQRRFMAYLVGIIGLLIAWVSLGVSLLDILGG